MPPVGGQSKLWPLLSHLRVLGASLMPSTRQRKGSKTVTCTERNELKSYSFPIRNNKTVTSTSFFIYTCKKCLFTWLSRCCFHVLNKPRSQLSRLLFSVRTFVCIAQRVQPLTARSFVLKSYTATIEATMLILGTVPKVSATNIKRQHPNEHLPGGSGDRD